MTEGLFLTVGIIVTALGFDFVNGFHDAANSIATIVATRVLKPMQAVLWAALFNFIAIFIFGTGVAKTMGSGMVDLTLVTPFVIWSGLLGAIGWGLITWWLKIPTSSSHALLGGYAGSAIVNNALRHGIGAAWDPIMASGWVPTLLFIVIAPFMGMAISAALMKTTMALEHKISAGRSKKIFSTLQLASSAFLSLMHGSNDAQKTAGIIAGVLVATGYSHEFILPYWVLFMSYSTMALGTLSGGWRIVETMGEKLTRLKPNGGFSAETAAALAILAATVARLPVSTTHATTGAILGAGAARKLNSVRWSLAANILWAWLLTIPCAALLGGLVMALMHAGGG